MKKLIILAAVISGMGAASSAWAVGAGNLTVTLADAGDGQTTISWAFSGAFTSYGASALSPGFSGFDPQFSGWINDLGSYTSPISLSGFGTFHQSGSENTSTLASVQFVSDGGSTDSLDLTTDATLSNGADDVAFTFSPSTDSETVDVPFSIFNPGTYTESTSYNTHGFATAINYTLDVLEPTPEPSTLALAGLGIAGLMAARRRK